MSFEQNDEIIQENQVKKHDLLQQSIDDNDNNDNDDNNNNDNNDVNDNKNNTSKDKNTVIDDNSSEADVNNDNKKKNENNWSLAYWGNIRKRWIFMGEKRI